MTGYVCGNELCRWAAFNGEHPNRIHAVWWGCTSRPPAPFARGVLVIHVADPKQPAVPVERCEWDSGTGWHVVVRYAPGKWGTVRHEPTMLAVYVPPSSPVQPSLFELETAS